MKIDGNQELCGGVQELHLPECPIKKSHKNKHKLSVLLKVVDPISQHVDTCHSDIALINFEGEKRRNRYLCPHLVQSFPKFPIRILLGQLTDSRRPI